MGEKSTIEEIIFDEKTAEVLVKNAADLVIKKLVFDQNIRLDNDQMDALAVITAERIKVDIDYPAVAKNVFETFTDLKSNELFLNEAIRGDLFEKIKKHIPVVKDGIDGKEGKPGIKGSDYNLTPEDRIVIADNIRKKLLSAKSGEAGLTEQVRADIAEEALSNLLTDKRSMKMIISAVAADDRIVSRDGFSRKLKELRDMITRSQKQSKGSHINAGISGQDMIDEITKILGEAWQTGGGLANLDIQTVIISSSDHTLVADNLNKTIRFDTSGVDRVFTIPVDILTEGKWTEIKRRGGGEVTLVRSGVTFESALGNVNVKINGEEGFSAFLETKSGVANTIEISGDIKAV